MACLLLHAVFIKMLIKVFCPFPQTAGHKNILMITKVNYCKWIGERAYHAKNIQVRLCLTPLVTGIIVCGYVNLKSNIEEFQRSSVSRWNPCTLKRIMS